MMNIGGAAGLAKRAIRSEVIAITNCYRTAGGQGLLFSYNRYYDAFPATVFVPVIFVEQPLLRQPLL